MSEDRKLATVQRVINVTPIENSDFLSAAQIHGWICVVKRDEFNIGDFVIYFEIDSFLPIKPEYEFLRKSSYKKVENLGEGFRIRTAKFRGTLSQGLVLPFSILEEYDPLYYKHFKEGDDVSDILGIQKYEKPIPACLRGLAKGNFPGFFPKTDAERIQNFFYDVTDEQKEDEYELSIKLDGTSFSAYYKDGEFGVCSRNLDLKDTEDNFYWQMARKYNLQEALTKYGRNLVIQGEGMGPGIQGNRENLKELELYVFSIYDPDHKRYLTSAERCQILTELDCGLKHTPILGFKHVFKEFNTVEDFLTFADRPSLNAPIAEGVVFKNQRDTSVIFKAINNRYLLKYDE